jgi:hypothetical protein
MKAYRVHIKQADHSDYTYGYERDFDVRAPTAGVALKRALAMAKNNGFQKSKPMAVTSIGELSSDLR